MDKVEKISKVCLMKLKGKVSSTRISKTELLKNCNSTINTVYLWYNWKMCECVRVILWCFSLLVIIVALGGCSNSSKASSSPEAKGVGYQIVDESHSAEKEGL